MQDLKDAFLNTGQPHFFIIFLHHEASEEDEDSRDEVEALKVS